MRISFLYLRFHSQSVSIEMHYTTKSFQQKSLRRTCTLLTILALDVDLIDAKYLP